MSEFAHDASAILTVLLREPGADRALAYLEQSRMISSVNLAEVVGKLVDYGLTDAEVGEALDALQLEVIEFDSALANATGKLRRQTRELRLSLGDRACLALGLVRALPVVTADRSWANAGLGVEVIFIR